MGDLKERVRKTIVGMKVAVALLGNMLINFVDKLIPLFGEL